MNTFENVREYIQENILRLVGDIETYIVCDVHARFSIYLISPPEGLQSAIQEAIGSNVERIGAIDIESYIYTDLNNKDYLPPQNIERKVYYVDRHIGLLNWDVTNRYESKVPIVCYYSFKGGVGRTTAMAITAIQLARKGKRVALLDFDLEAPGLASLFSSDFPDIEQFRGVADYLVDLISFKYNEDNVTLGDYYYAINRQDIVGSQGGELLVFPATIMSAEENLYLSKFSKLNSVFQSNSKYPIDYLLKRIEKDLNPDYILIDTRTGLNDLGGVFLTRYASQSFLFFYGNRQNMFGLESILPKLKQHENLKFYLVNSPVPPAPLAQDERDYFLERSYALFSDLYYPANESPYIADETALHYPIEVPYNNLAVLLDSSDKLKALAEEDNGNNPYLKMATLISGTNLKANESSTQVLNSNDQIIALLNGFKSISPDGSSASEYEFKELKNLTNSFYPRKDYKFIFDKNKYLILGEKGAGKTALYAVLSHKEYAFALAEYCEANDAEISKTIWVKGLDITNEYPSSAVFESLTSEDPKTCRNFWQLLLLRYVKTDESEVKKAIDWKQFIQESKDSNPMDIEVRIQNLNLALQEKNQFVTVIYDYLDVQIKEEGALRGKLLSALLEIWRDIQARFPFLRSKIFMRKDIFDREINLTDKVKFNNHNSEISWEYDQLLNVVWKRLWHSGYALPEWLKTSISDKSDKRELLGLIPELQESENRRLLEKLLGEYMGGNNKAFPYNWILYHVSDTKRRVQPRSLLNLFSEAAAKQLAEKDNQDRDYPLKPRNMELAMDKVSQHRVQDIREEYPSLQLVFDDLKNHHQQFPIEESALDRALTEISRQSTELSKIGIPEIKRRLEDIGVLYEYKFTPKNKEKRYHIPDLYLIGMGLKRKGPGAHKALFGKK